jgi:exonuclease VII small subunit
MARLKRSSTPLDKAERRIAGIKSIGSKVALGNALSIPAYADSIALVRQRLEAYNSALSTVDAAQQALEDAEKDLAAISKKMLAAIAFNYGDDSTEYSMAGGVRMSDRKKTPRKSNAAANEATNAQKTAQKTELVTA